MSDKPPPKKTVSGEHGAVRAFRDKLESIQDGALEALRELNRKLEEEIGDSRPPKKDPRREGESEPPVDKVEFPTIPAPKEPKP